MKGDIQMHSEKCGACIAKTLMELIEYRDKTSDIVADYEQKYGEEDVRYISALSEWGAVVTCVETIKRYISEM